MTDALAKFDGERAALGPAAKFVLTTAIDLMGIKTQELQVCAGGRTDGTVWSDHYDDKSPIMSFFLETLDKLKPGPLNKLSKDLQKVTGASSHVGLIVGPLRLHNFY